MQTSRDHTWPHWLITRLQIGELDRRESQRFNKVALPDAVLVSVSVEAASSGEDLRSTDHESEVRACGFIAF
ncbi:hypothetical protein XH94_38115 [Bradyrhizobium zhanjiangense]|uniref:Uncharacterized protein n=1 Tax=Bradyrhizobium zhanjiangense TaxID=1325107 RepID=A0A4V1L0S2_9BRAD|nr:hypothetical protein XH94_38115 [Bradyrhizobium zhanjiangense]